MALSGFLGWLVSRSLRDLVDVGVLGLSGDGDEVPGRRAFEAILDEERGSGHVSVTLPGELVEARIVAKGHQLGGGRDRSSDARRHRDSQFGLERGGYAEIGVD